MHLAVLLETLRLRFSTFPPLSPQFHRVQKSSNCQYLRQMCQLGLLRLALSTPLLLQWFVEGRSGLTLGFNQSAMLVLANAAITMATRCLAINWFVMLRPIPNFRFVNQIARTMISHCLHRPPNELLHYQLPPRGQRGFVHCFELLSLLAYDFSFTGFDWSWNDQRVLQAFLMAARRNE